MRSVTPPTRHRVSSEGLFFFSSRINFKLVHSYNVKQLTCIIFYSSGLQNICTSSMYESVQHLQYLHWFTKFHIQNRPKGLPVAPIDDVWPLTADVDCPVLWFPLLYLHGLNTRAKLYT